MLQEVVEVLVDVLGLGAHGADGIAVVAVVEEHIAVPAERLELRGCACARAVVVLAASHGEVLVT